MLAPTAVPQRGGKHAGPQRARVWLEEGPRGQSPRARAHSASLTTHFPASLGSPRAARAAALLRVAAPGVVRRQGSAGR